VTKTRPAGEGDWPFIVHSWVESIRGCVDAGRALTRSEHWDTYTRVIDRLRQRRGLLASVAVNQEQPDQIFGYLISETGWPWPVVHFSFVKAPFRQFGIAKLLLGEAGITADFHFPFRTGRLAELKRAGHYRHAVHDPLVLQFSPEERHHRR